MPNPPVKAVGLAFVPYRLAANFRESLIQTHILTQQIQKSLKSHSMMKSKVDWDVKKIHNALSNISDIPNQLAGVLQLFFSSTSNYQFNLDMVKQTLFEDEQARLDGTPLLQYKIEDIAKMTVGAVSFKDGRTLKFSHRSSTRGEIRGQAFIDLLAAYQAQADLTIVQVLAMDYFTSLWSKIAITTILGHFQSGYSVLKMISDSGKSKENLTFKSYLQDIEAFVGVKLSDNKQVPLVKGGKLTLAFEQIAMDISTAFPPPSSDSKSLQPLIKEAKTQAQSVFECLEFNCGATVGNLTSLLTKWHMRSLYDEYLNCLMILQQGFHSSVNDKPSEKPRRRFTFSLRQGKQNYAHVLQSSLLDLSVHMNDSSYKKQPPLSRIQDFSRLLKAQHKAIIAAGKRDRRCDQALLELYSNESLTIKRKVDGMASGRIKHDVSKPSVSKDRKSSRRRPKN